MSLKFLLPLLVAIVHSLFAVPQDTLRYNRFLVEDKPGVGEAGNVAASQPDLVVNLPGLAKQPAWKHYSGYLKASGTKKLHYWFIESANKPSTDPLVLWMNGGPGCSSDLGLLTEHGPFRISKDGSGVTYNKYSWNNVANMLYLEAPAGVGYSYSEDKNYTTSDDEVASDNYLALKSFFVKFPEYKSNPFYITGESYGGIYVPTLSAIVLHDSSMNFQGMAIGNGISNFDTNDDSLLYFGYYHGLIGEDLWNKMLNACCPGQSVRQCHFQTGYTYNSDCSDLVGQGLDVITSSGLNEYNLYAPCDVPKPDGYIYNNNSFVYDVPSFGHQNHPYMIKKLNKIKLHQQYEESVQLTPPCLDYGYAISYMNTAEVRVALHISPFAQDWDVCSADVGSTYVSQYNDVTKFYQEVLSAGKSVLVYNGDIDMACNFLGDEWFVEKLNLPVERQRGPWYVTDSNGNKQVAGFTKQFKQLTLTTIRGAGHMVPQDKPEAALEMFASFVQAKRN
ncbi:lysosomal protective protein-like isoform X1 [Mya arenaria]|uniref:lysosomal protective protein-like isoform X1 n=1 Tax=Mya arenaria TaxID=6604 RepID=UPI0022E270C7|nr:lysosomal protective protein-like isoform X1 [Mya arenaria]XP_052815248.1 lysosomal protective protein-like isoform X1 [Mya arenaria]